MMMTATSFCLYLVSFFCLAQLLTAAKTPKHMPRCFIGKPFIPRIKDIPNNAAILQIHGPKNWLPTDVSKLQLSFSPPLAQGEDFSIWAEPNEHALPEQYQVKPYPTVLYILLTPGKKWIKNFTSHIPQPLVLESILCPRATQPDKSTPSLLVGNIIAERTNCPTSLNNLPDASVELQRKVNTVLYHCQDPMIVRSGDLNWKHHHSLSLLMMQPSVMFIDGSDQKMFQAARSVDRFLAAHGVLDVVWEPMREEEPQYWILMPRPLGMPGHMFAMLDLMQWRHPLVTKDQFSNDLTGCKHTQLAGISGSGYSADAFNLFNVLRVGFMSNLPVQAFPSTLNKRSEPPFWEGVQGWTYAFKACKTNFLDCYFLDHSPCPKIRYNLFEKKYQQFLNLSRLQMPKPERPFEMTPKWWVQAMGQAKHGVNSIPKKSISDLSNEATPTRMVFYSYLFRPNYFVRQQIVQRVKEFNLGTCAAMHVRRGDVLLHPRQARFYVPLHAYVRGAQAFMKALGVTTILLLTDSQAVIEESLACKKDFPELCGDISWRYVEKKRWYGAEGGWENPFPSGNAMEEFMNIKLELALSQKCDLMIQGSSGYGDMVFNHMCCKFPLHDRGELPQRCICPPKVRLKQDGFTCETGNTIMCGHQHRGGEIQKRLDDPANMLGANFSKTKNAIKQDTRVFLFPHSPHNFRSFALSNVSAPNVIESLQASAKEAFRQVCLDSYDSGPPRKPSICRDRVGLRS